MVGHDVGVFGELLLADSAFAVLGDDLPVQQLSHFRVRADFAVSPRVMGIVNATDSHLARLFLFGIASLPQQNRER